MDGDDSPWGDVPTQSKNGSKENTSSDSKVAGTNAPVKPAGGRQPRPGKRQPAHSSRLEAIGDDLDPLGPLGAKVEAAEEPEEPPALPRKENHAGAPQTKTASPAAQRNRPDISQEPLPSRPKSSYAGQTANDGMSRQTQASMSVEQASKPWFNISVGDPHKVGDLTSSHTVFQVRTRTSSMAYRTSEFEVSRRYKDFLWLYNQLHSNNPGVVVPPPPDKQAVGRFDTNFVESRRAALERMLNKTAAHPILQHDGDLKLFLESESFNVDVKHRERKDPDMPETKGMFSGLNLSVGSNAKFVEHDDWFLDRRAYLDILETQLKGLLKATDTAISQRKMLAEASAEFSGSLDTLSQVELSPTLSGPLASLSDLQLRIRDLYDRQAQQDVLTLGIVIDEYIRLIGSIKKAFEQRQRSWQGWHNADSDLQKRRSALDKLMRQGRSQQDKMSQLQADVGDAERRAHQAKLQFDDLGKGMRAELERFEREKVEDFRMGVETYLESAVEAQKELIELWETYLMHFDAESEEPNPVKDRVAPQAVPTSSENAASASTEVPDARPSENGIDNAPREESHVE